MEYPCLIHLDAMLCSYKLAKQMGKTTEEVSQMCYNQLRDKLVNCDQCAQFGKLT